jgi:hypothetical protein
MSLAGGPPSIAPHGRGQDRRVGNAPPACFNTGRAGGRTSNNSMMVPVTSPARGFTAVYLWPASLTARDFSPLTPRARMAALPRAATIT